MAEITEGKYKGLDESKKTEIINQGGTLVGAPIIRSSESAFSLNAPDINWSGYKIHVDEEDVPITYTGDLIEILNSGGISSNNSSVNVSVDENDNSITIGNTTYVLMFDENTGKLSLSKDVYDAISLRDTTSDISQSCEYKSSPLANSTTIALHTTASKPVATFTPWTASSNASVGSTTFSGLTYSATGEYGPVQNGTSTVTYTWSFSATEVQQGSHSQSSASKTVTVKYTFDKYAYWCGVNTELVTNGNGLTKSSSLHTPTPNRIYFTDSQFNGTAKYIYFAIKGTGNHVFYITSGTNDTQVAGGIVKIGTIQEYSDVNYTLYRSDEKQTGACNVRIA